VIYILSADILEMQNKWKVILSEMEKCRFEEENLKVGKVVECKKSN
jgi:hypothetical protein